MNKKIVFEFKIYTDGDCHNPIEYMETHESQYFDNDFYEYTNCDDYDGSIRRVFDYEPDEIDAFKELIVKICKDTTDGLHSQSTKEYLDEFLDDMKSRIFRFVDRGNDLSDGRYMESNVEIEWHLHIVETNVKKIEEVIYETSSDDAPYLSFENKVDDDVILSIRDTINRALADNKSECVIPLYPDDIGDIARFEVKFYEYFNGPMRRCKLVFASDLKSDNEKVRLYVKWKMHDDNGPNGGWYLDFENIKLAIANNINHIFIKIPDALCYTCRLTYQLFNSIIIHIDDPMTIFKDVDCKLVKHGNEGFGIYKLSWNVDADGHDNRIYKLFNDLGPTFGYIEDVIEGREEHPCDNNMKITVSFQLRPGDIFDIVRFMEERFPDSYCDSYNYRPLPVSPKHKWDMEIHDYGCHGADIQFKII